MTGPRTTIVSVPDAALRAREARQRGEVVVLCHGCFDIVHPGHVRHLQQARRLGDRLIVTVTGDAAVGKGLGRPLIPQELRAENVAALDCVDWVAIHDEPTAIGALEQIRPDVYVKGREYEQNHDPRFEAEKEIVQRHRGRVVFTSGDVVFSSTALIRTMESSLAPDHAALRRLFEREEVALSSAEETLARFRQQRVLVIGETIIDTYVMCDRPDVAGESPIMTLRPIARRSFDGGAAIIARHVAAMGAEAVLLTSLPPAPEAHALARRLEVEGLEVHSMPLDGALIEKQRFLVGASKVMKLDLAQPLVPDETDRQRLLREAASLAEGCSAAIIADFGQGLFSGPMLNDLCRAVRPHVQVLSGDVSGRRSNLLAMRSMDLLCPSELEMRDALRNYEEGLSAVAWHLLERTESTAALVTLGGEGLTIFEHRGERLAADWTSALRAEHVPPLTQHPIDQLGCGDALLAAANLTKSAGGSLALAALIGSIAAACEGQKLGNVVISASELRQGIGRLLEAHLCCAV